MMSLWHANIITHKVRIHEEHNTFLKVRCISICLLSTKIVWPSSKSNGAKKGKRWHLNSEREKILKTGKDNGKLHIFLPLLDQSQIHPSASYAVYHPQLHDKCLSLPYQVYKNPRYNCCFRIVESNSACWYKLQKILQSISL